MMLPPERECSTAATSMPLAESCTSWLYFSISWLRRFLSSASFLRNAHSFTSEIHVDTMSSETQCSSVLSSSRLAVSSRSLLLGTTGQVAVDLLHLFPGGHPCSLLVLPTPFNLMEWLHGGQLLESRKDTCSFLHVRPVLASHIHGEELGFGWHEFLLKIQGAFKRNPWRHTATSIPSSSSLEALLDVSLAAVHWESPHVPLPWLNNNIVKTAPSTSPKAIELPVSIGRNSQHLRRAGRADERSTTAELVFLIRGIGELQKAALQCISLCKGLSGESRRDDLELFKGAQEVQGVKCGNTDRSWPVSTLKEDFQVGGPLLLASIVGGVVSLLSSTLRLSAAEKTRMRQSFFEAQEEDMRKECSIRRTSTLDDWKPSVGGDVTVKHHTEG
ncbi:hypothetical protein F7725_020141 [Dissostichus mawsoni]|uniref:Uncharacterized protein n=1 Tax=Dissostichus mawsoni TaxID=36200 RepID=A0A7J5YD98_DISMA|nr:hypothetical protein F7725_020141 [Dissostichus mawsoni]